jgi:hypothetical protein
MRTRAGLKSRTLRSTHSVKDLLQHRTPILTRLTDQAARQDLWNAWLSTHLPGGLRARVSGVNERDGTLVVFAESAAWCARLRYALAELEPLLRAERPAVAAIEVRVLPRA